MSASGDSGPAVVVTQPHGGALRPWRRGQSGNPSGLSKERRELYQAIEKTEVPKVLTMLAALYDRGLEGDVAAARLWLDHVRGPVKARDEDALEQAVEQKVMEMIAEARARKMQTQASNDES
jgi:hypothetical protein